MELLGLHLTSKRLLQTNVRSLADEYLLSASCHNADELLHAANIGVDYIFLGPVVEKHLSQNSNPLGWEVFADLVQTSKIPVYAIGGLTKTDIDTSIENGGQGIAAIRDLWLEA